MARSLYTQRSGLKKSSARKLPVAVVTAIITFLPSVFIPGMLSAGMAAGATVTFSGNTNTGGSTAAQTSSNSAALTSNGFTKTGYAFTGWNTVLGGTGTTYANGATFAFTTNTTLYAQWTLISYLYDPSSGSAITVNNPQTWTSSLKTKGNAASTLSGYTLAGWCTNPLSPGETCASVSGTFFGFPVVNVPTSPATATVNLYAVWTANTLSITYDTQGRSGISNGSTKTGGAIASSPGTPTLAGYTFDGWFLASTGGTAIAFPYSHGQTAGFTLYAHWIQNTITWNENGARPITDIHGSLSYNVGESITFVEDSPTRDGYQFEGWFTAITGGTEVTTSYSPPSPFGPQTFFAHWIPNSNAIAWHDEGADIRDSSGGADNFLSGSPIAAIPTTAPQKTGYNFAGWFTAQSGGTEVTSGSYTPIIYDLVEIWAHWTANENINQSYSITWNDQGATTASSGGAATYANGSSVATIPSTAPQKTGYTFVGWFTAANSGLQLTNGSYLPPSPYGELTFYAHWSAIRTSTMGTWAWTNQSSAGSANWHALATSADGAKLFAGVDSGGSLYRSTDFGVTWSTIAGTSGHNWFSIASNIDGTKVVAVDHGGDIWTSTDSGSTWTQRSVGAVRDWESIASSSDGVKLVAVASNGSSNGFIYTSLNSGATWSSNLAPAGTNRFTGVTSSNDGNNLAATTWANGIFTSSNAGQTWIPRTLPVPNTNSATYLQAVASSGDGSRLVTGSRRAGGSNGGVIFTSADYGATWKSYAQTQYDFINFVSNGDGSRLAATIYGQQGVSTSGDFGATWAFQSLGSSGVIPLASNIDGSLLFAAGFGGNLWTGKVPNSRVVAVLPASTSANLAASANMPSTTLTFSAGGSSSGLTLTPISNPTSEASTPFDVAKASIFDIAVVNITGRVTICVDGGPSVRLWHFTNGAWVDVTTSSTDTQTCGLTSSFSPFATAIRANIVQSDESSRNAKAKAETDAAEAKRETEKQSARSEITSKMETAKDLSVETFSKAEIPGVTAGNIAAVQAEILALPESSRGDLNQVLKVARKYEIVGNIASDQVNSLLPTSLVEIGLIPATSKNKVALMSAIRKLPATARDTFAEIKAAIDAETIKIKLRNDRLAAIVARKTTRSTQK